MTDEKPAPANAVVIKKYANRRLYNTATSTYVTLDDLAQMVKSGTDFVVFDAKTGEDITRSVLTQIIFDEENKGTNLLPINFLRQLIRFYGDSMQAFVPGYLEFSMDSLTQEQEKWRKQVMDAFGGDTFKGVEDQVKRNMAMFNDAMRMFNPFASMGLGGGMSGMGGMPGMGGGPAAAAPKTEGEASKTELQSLKEQLAEMQKKLNSLSGS